MTDLRATDPAAAERLLTSLRHEKWLWTTDEFDRVAADLGWTNPVRVDGAPAFADAPWDLGGREVAVVVADNHVDTIRIRVTDRAVRKSDESLAFMRESWQSLVALATELLGPPTLQIGGDNPDVQWRGDEATIGVQNVKVAVVVNWAGNAYQDRWNSLRGPG